MTISDINTNISFLTKTNTTSFPAADRLILINKAYNRVVSLILQADGRWQWDDSNRTDLPTATTALVSGQSDYALASSHLRITGVEVKDGSGNWTRLAPYDHTDTIQSGQSQTELQSDTGTPNAYDVLGNSVFLYPTPNYSQSASLKVYFQRGPAEFTSGEVNTGTKEPGFNSLYHSLIPLWVAYDYCLTNIPKLAPGYFTEIQRLEDQIVKDYGRRDKDERARMTFMGIQFR